jgi:two-component system cell cycle sensor histidine kinase/response regulator CckA
VCVLLDLTMPHMDGEETLRRLRQIRPTVKVAIVSGYSENIAQRFEGMGLAAVLKKPYRLGSLASTLRGIVEGESQSATLGRRSTE